MSVLGPFDPPRRRGALSGKGERGSTAPASGAPTTHTVTRPGLPYATTARFLTEVLLADASRASEVVAELEAAVDETVVVWSPSFYTTCRTELVTALLERDDALTEMAVDIVSTAVTGSRAFVEWRVAGRFGREGFLNDDLLVEPSFRAVRSGGVTVVHFVGSHAARIDVYFDGLGLLEQVLPPGEGVVGARAAPWLNVKRPAGRRPGR